MAGSQGFGTPGYPHVPGDPSAPGYSAPPPNQAPPYYQPALYGSPPPQYYAFSQGPAAPYDPAMGQYTGAPYSQGVPQNPNAFYYPPIPQNLNTVSYVPVPLQNQGLSQHAPSVQHPSVPWHASVPPHRGATSYAVSPQVANDPYRTSATYYPGAPHHAASPQAQVDPRYVPAPSVPPQPSAPQYPLPGTFILYQPRRETFSTTSGRAPGPGVVSIWIVPMTSGWHDRGENVKRKQQLRENWWQPIEWHTQAEKPTIPPDKCLVTKSSGAIGYITRKPIPLQYIAPPPGENYTASRERIPGIRPDYLWVGDIGEPIPLSDAGALMNRILYPYYDIDQEYLSTLHSEMAYWKINGPSPPKVPGDLIPEFWGPAYDAPLSRATR
ncbi:hypothetical protein OBBRIDRAFT_835265 [Obba rivulosa]|uniref:Uncharacterized protein n=1 Tax=Obba rivulosa TaxID=1052685 RepID=A0A8E2DLQ8_9APHY|nr:hypothetical protein OBBRIDRAFT_835265 [Obba rivulosa]